MDCINVGIIGFGTVGSGTVEILITNRDLISKRAGIPIRLKAIADLDLEKDRGIDLSGIALTRDAYEVVEDPDIQIVAELIGGIDQAKEYVEAAIQKRKHVVTANKALLAHFGSELFQLAKRQNVLIGFEASVAGGIPLITAVQNGLTANQIQKLMAILNGTSNYILTKMRSDHKPYQEVVSEAVKLGYAEDPPTLDVDGTDVAHKLIILLALFYGKWFPFEDLFKEGIQEITPQDINFAEEFGYRIKLLGMAKLKENQIEARVHPVMIPKDHMLSGVEGAFNGIYIEGDYVGPTLFYGLGAGRRPTGSAVVSDIVAIARKIRSHQQTFEASLCNESYEGSLSLRPMEEVETPYYFRFSAKDKPGVLSKISGILGRYEISIASVIQKGRVLEGSVPIVMLTHEAKEKAVRAAIKEIDRLDVVTDRTLMIRVEAENAL